MAGNFNSRQRSAAPHVVYPQNPLEVHYSLQEIAKEWKVDAETVRNAFIDEPGVLELGRRNRRDGKRNYVVLRIPASVLKRVYERRTQRKFHTPQEHVTITMGRDVRVGHSSSLKEDGKTIERNDCNG